MACLATVVMNSRGGLQVLFVSFTKGPGGFPYVLIITTWVPTLVPIDGTTLVDNRVFVLGGDQEVFDGSATHEVSFDAISTTDLFDTFTKTLCVGNDYVPFVFHFMVGSLGIIGAPINHLPGRPVESFLHLVQGPFGIVAFSESFPEVILFFLEQLWIAAYCGGPVGEGLDDPKLGWEVMVAVPLYGSVCMGFLYTAMDREPSTSGLTIVSKKGMEPSSLLSSTVNLMAGSTLFMCWRKPCLLASLWMTKVSSTCLHQNLGGWGAVLRAFCSKYSMYKLATMGLTGEPMAAPSTCS